MKKLILSAICLVPAALFASAASSQGSTQEQLDAFPVNVGGKWGIVDANGGEILPTEFDTISIRPDGEFWIEKGELSGSFRAGQPINEVLKSGPAAWFGKSDFGVAWLDYSPVVVDRNRKIVLGPGLTHITQFDGKRHFIVKIGDSAGVLSLDCEWIIPPEFATIERLADNGLALAWPKDDDRGFVDAQGAWVIPPGQFDGLASFAADGLAAAKKGGKWGFIDAEGDWVIEPIHESRYAPRRFDDQGLTVIDVGRKPAILERSGVVAGPLPFDFVSVRGDMLYASKGGLSGVIDRNGKVVVPIEFDSIGPFSNQGLALARKGGRWLIIDKAANDVFGGRFQMVGAFTQNGWAPALHAGKWGAIDFAGNWVLEPAYDCVGQCYDEKFGATPPPLALRRDPNWGAQVPSEYITKPHEQSWCKAGK